jgi:23S rRNA pseudouridine1911/1915/1917 synthase
VNQPPAILFEDEHCVAVAKAAGQFPLGTYAPPGETTLEAAVRSHLDESNPGGVYLGIVHRLDRPTSGVLIWAKTPKAARRLSRQFETRRAIKEYWAVVGFLPGGRTADSQQPLVIDPQDVNRRETWVDSLSRPDRAGVVWIAPGKTEGAREAITEVAAGRPVSLPARSMWLRLWPRTGRAHQLRVQAAARGMPILGDAIYGSDRPFQPEAAIALHAYRLQVVHPITGAKLELSAPVPNAWAAHGIVLCDPR